MSVSNCNLKRQTNQDPLVYSETSQSGRTHFSRFIDGLRRWFQRTKEKWDARKPIVIPTGIFLLLIFVTGTVFLFLAHAKWHQDWLPYFPDVLRDLGVGLIVSTTIAVVIDFYLFLKQRYGAMWDLFDLFMSEQITREVWLELKDVINGKAVIRRNAHIRASFVCSCIQNPLMHEFDVEFGYELHGLRQKPSSMTLVHELDYQFESPDSHLPRFTKFAVDDGAQSSCTENAQALQESKRTKKISRRVVVPARGGRPVRVWLERRELVPVPGSYNLYTPDFIKGLRVVISETPKDIDVQVFIRPQGAMEVLRRVGSTWYSDDLILPGQGVELKFLVRKSAIEEVELESAPESALSVR